MICVSDFEMEIIQKIIQEYASDCDVFAFGSRYKWISRDSSDLDLAFARKDKKRFDLNRFSILNEAFSESDLPFKVDVLDYHGVSDAFRKIIDAGNERIYEGKQETNQKLSDVCKGGGSYGIAASAVQYSTTLPTYLRITDINDNGTLNKDGLKSVDNPNSGKYYLVPNDIVFARTGASTGRNYFYDGSDGEFVYAGFLIKFSIDPQKVNPQFIKYYCQSKEYYDWINSFNTGSTRGNINAVTLGNMPIPIIPREQQDLIVNTLSALDAKIANNTKINHHLEQIAQAIFKSWFVDFEPWGGVMPNDWHEGVLSDICTYSSEKVSVSTLTAYNYISTENMSTDKRGIVKATKLPTILQTTSFSVGDTLVSNIRPYFRKIVHCSFIGGCSTDVLCFRPHNSNLSYYLYNALYSDNFFRYMVAGSKGTKMPRGDKQQIMNYQIIIPSNNIIDDFVSVVTPIMEKKQVTTEETIHLVALHNIILPRLISGELSTDEFK